MMVIADFCVGWLAYVHVAMFSVLPSVMFDSISLITHPRLQTRLSH